MLTALESSRGDAGTTACRSPPAPGNGAWLL